LVAAPGAATSTDGQFRGFPEIDLDQRQIDRPDRGLQEISRWKSKRYRYYVCYQAQQRGWKNCETKSVSAPAIEAAVLESIRKLGANPALAAETVRQARVQLARRIEEAELEQAAVQKQLRQFNAELAHLAGDGAMQSSERLDRLVAVQKEIQATEQRLCELAEELQELRDDASDEQDLVQALEQFDPVWNSLTTREQAKLVHLLIEKVGYDGRTGKVTVSFRSAGLKELCNGKDETKTQQR
jgi:site-specific DNA recombinase